MENKLKYLLAKAEKDQSQLNDTLSKLLGEVVTTGNKRPSTRLNLRDSFQSSYDILLTRVKLVLKDTLMNGIIYMKPIVVDRERKLSVLVKSYGRVSEYEFDYNKMTANIEEFNSYVDEIKQTL